MARTKQTARSSSSSKAPKSTQNEDKLPITEGASGGPPPPPPSEGSSGGPPPPPPAAPKQAPAAPVRVRKLDVTDVPNIQASKKGQGGHSIAVASTSLTSEVKCIQKTLNITLFIICVN